MPDVLTLLTTRFQAAVAAAFGDAHAATDPLIRPSGNPQFGDYQANLAMSLAKQLGAKPREVAEKIKAAVDLNGICEKVEIAGPGFINLYLSPAFLNERMNSIASDERLGVSAAAPAQTVVIDYSSPNVAKEMHVGHLRSTIIGDAIARVMTFLGHRVIRQNHVGDWGTQFGMLIEHLTDIGWNPKGEHSISDLNALYQAAKKHFDDDAAFAERSRKRVVALQAGDAGTIALWKGLIEESKHHFNEAYQRLGVMLGDADIRGESAYNAHLSDVVASLQQSGLAKESQGAIVLFPAGFKDAEGNPQPMIIRKSDGGYLYATTDLAAARFRIGELKADRVIYVTDARQGDHFAMLFWALREAGWAKKQLELDHVPFGMVLGPDKRPFKTREGGTVKLVELLDEAVDRARKVIEEKNPELSPDERKRVAQAVGIGALKYADLSVDRVKDYVFDWDRMLSFDGNTAPYIQNAYVRVHGIFRKGGIDPRALRDARITVAEPAERALAVKLLQLPAVIASVAQSLEPHRLCAWLYDTAAGYHRFFESCPVLAAPDEATRQSRLRLSELTARAFKLGLGLLGIDVVERM